MPKCHYCNDSKNIGIFSKTIQRTRSYTNVHSPQVSRKDYSLDIYVINTPMTFSETARPGVLTVFIIS